MEKGEYLHESLMKNVLEDTVIATISIRKGVPGIMQGFRDLIAEYGADLFVTVDIGADAFFTGTETQVQSPLIDAISILCASELEIPGVYGVNAIGGDAEMPMAHIIRNIGMAMQKGAFIGGNGLTQEDINTYGEILKWIPGEEVEKWPYEAAQGHFGTFYCKRLWSVEMTPAAAFTFFFDPDILREVNPIVNAIKDTKTLQQAEEIIMKDFNLFPETRLPVNRTAPTALQIRINALAGIYLLEEILKWKRIIKREFLRAQCYVLVEIVQLFAESQFSRDTIWLRRSFPKSQEIWTRQSLLSVLPSLSDRQWDF